MSAQPELCMFLFPQHGHSLICSDSYRQAIRRENTKSIFRAIKVNNISVKFKFICKCSHGLENKKQNQHLVDLKKIKNCKIYLDIYNKHMQYLCNNK